MSRALVLVALAVSAVPALAHAQAVADRYGPAAASAPQSAGSAPEGRRMLSWPGKTTARAGAYAPQAYAAPAGSPPALAGSGRYAPRFATTAPSSRRYAAPRSDAVSPSRPAGEDGWRPVYASAAPPALTGGPARPTSIYAPAARASGAAQAASAAPPRGAPASQRYGYDPTETHRVRLYSVARPFGLQPDPAPIPPQFFTNTADLADPPAQLPLERSSTAGSTTSSTRTVRAVADTSTN